MRWLAVFQYVVSKMAPNHETRWSEVRQFGPPTPGGLRPSFPSIANCTSIQANAPSLLPNQLSFTLYSTTPTAMAELDQRTDDYHPKDALGDAIKATLVTGGAGAFISTIQNTLTKQNVGA